MKIKVPVETLIAAAEKERERIVSAWEKQQHGVDEATTKWVSKARDALVKTIDNIDNGKLPDISSGYGRRPSSYLTVNVPVLAPASKSDAPNTGQVDRDLALLRASAEPTISVGTDDNFARYLG